MGFGKQKKIGRSKKGKMHYTKKQLAERAARQEGQLPIVTPPRPSKRAKRATDTETIFHGPQYDDSYQFIKHKGRRIAIAYHFMQVHHADPDEKKWHGKGGIIPSIKKALEISENTKIEPILRQCLMCKERGVEYNGEIESARTGRIPATKIPSQEATIIANNLERGM